MFQFAFPSALFAFKYADPASAPLFRLPPERNKAVNHLPLVCILLSWLLLLFA